MRPFVHVNCAMSADGKIAGTDRTQVAISSEEDRLRAKNLRSGYDAILVGVGTVVADDPHLTLKGLDYDTNPVRVVLDPHGRTPDEAQVLDERAPTVMVTLETCDREWDCEETIRAGTDSIDLEEVLAELSEFGIENVLVEGGGETISSFFRAGLVDRYTVFVGGLVIGGRDSPTPCDGDGWAAEGGVKLELKSSEVLGNGVLMTFEPVRRLELRTAGLQREPEVVAVRAEDLAGGHRVGPPGGVLEDLREEARGVVAQGPRGVLRERHVVLDHDGQGVQGVHAGVPHPHLPVVVPGVGDGVLDRVRGQGAADGHRVDRAEDGRYRLHRQAHAVEPQEKEPEDPVAGLHGVVRHVGQHLHGHREGLVGGRLGVRQGHGYQGVHLAPAVLRVVVDGDHAVADHLVEMDRQRGLGLPGDLGEVRQRQIPVLQLVEDLASDLV